MHTDTVVRARIDPDIKARATEALEALGLSVSGRHSSAADTHSGGKAPAVYRTEYPMPSTTKALNELESGKGKRFDTLDDLFQDLGI